MIYTDAQLIWSCRRGMLELDLILSRFVETQLKHLNESERTHFAHLLEYPDPDLFSWLMGHGTPDDEELSRLVSRLRSQHSI